MKKSFTLIKLIVVIGIIAVLAAVISVSVFKAIEKAKVTKAIADMKTIGSAALAHYVDTGKYPPDGDIWPRYDSGLGFFVNDDGAGNPVEGQDGPYIEKWPLNPWSKEVDPLTTYQWDINDIDGDGVFEWCVEIGLGGSNEEEIDLIADRIDNALDDGDGPCEGIFRGYCPPGPEHWHTWPKLVVVKK